MGLFIVHVIKHAICDKSLGVFSLLIALLMLVFINYRINIF